MKKTNVVKLKEPIMKIKKHILKDKSLSFYVFLIIFSIIYLLVYYKNVGIHDVGAYIDTGKTLIDQKNPYALSGAKWGTFGPIVLLSIYSILPKAVVGMAFQLMNIFGVYVFLRIFVNKSNNATFHLIFLLILWLSSTREMLAINQITGIVFGCIALGNFFLPLNIKNKDSFINQIISVFFFSVAIDLKPHTVIYLFVIIVVLKKSFKLLIYTSFFLFISHSIINLYVGSILELDWIRAISKVSSSASKNQLGDSVSFWPLLNYYFKSPKLFFSASIVLVLILFIVSLYLAYKHKPDMAMFFAILVPSFSIYYHFYDLIPLCIIVLNWAILNQQYVYSSFILSFILIPKEYLSYRNNFLVLFLELILTYYFLSGIKEFKISTLIKIVVGVVLTYLVHFFNSYLNFNSFMLQSLIVSEALLMIYFVVYLNRRKTSLLIGI